MKIHKMFSIDLEVAEWLAKQDNASQLVNRLLLEYMERNALEMMTPEQLKREKEALELIVEAKKKAQEIRNGRNKSN